MKSYIQKINNITSLQFCIALFLFYNVFKSKNLYIELFKIPEFFFNTQNNYFFDFSYATINYLSIEYVIFSLLICLALFLILRRSFFFISATIIYLMICAVDVSFGLVDHKIFQNIWGGILIIVCISSFYHESERLKKSLHFLKIYFLLFIFSAGYSKLFVSGLDWILDNHLIIYFDMRELSSSGLIFHILNNKFLYISLNVLVVAAELSAPLALYKKSLYKYVLISVIFLGLLAVFFIKIKIQSIFAISFILLLFDFLSSHEAKWPTSEID